MSQPLAIDLCCGKGGWTDSLLRLGYRVKGYDIEHWEGYKGELTIADVRTLRGEMFKGANLIVASPPCQEFSLFGLKHFHPNPPYPHLGIELFNACRRICEESKAPYVIENVRSAQRFVGRADQHCGPYYLWGTGIPALFRPEAFKLTKGTKFYLPRDKRRLGGDLYYNTGSKSRRRRNYAAQIAMIPREIAEEVGRLWL